MAGRVGFLPRGFKHLTPLDDDDLDTSPETRFIDLDDDEAASYFVTEHTAATVHDRFYDEDDSDYSLFTSARVFTTPKKIR